MTNWLENFDVDDDTDFMLRVFPLPIGSEMSKDAVMAVIIATICMLLYIWFRFKDIRFAASAVLALVHDVLVVLHVLCSVQYVPWEIPSSPAC